LTSLLQQELHVTVAQAWAQVAAGMNYRWLLLITNGATVALKRSEPSGGAFAVTVYDYFGMLQLLCGVNMKYCALKRR
jgi:hypothetical protein